MKNIHELSKIEEENKQLRQRVADLEEEIGRDGILSYYKEISGPLIAYQQDQSPKNARRLRGNIQEYLLRAAQEWSEPEAAKIRKYCPELADKSQIQRWLKMLLVPELASSAQRAA